MTIAASILYNTNLTQRRVRLPLRGGGLRRGQGNRSLQRFDILWDQVECSLHSLRRRQQRDDGLLRVLDGLQCSQAQVELFSTLRPPNLTSIASARSLISWTGSSMSTTKTVAGRSIPRSEHAKHFKNRFSCRNCQSGMNRLYQLSLFHNFHFQCYKALLTQIRINHRRWRLWCQVSTQWWEWRWIDISIEIIVPF